METEFIKIRGAKENNLKNVSVDIPKNKLVVLTGVSGCGKSSLAFDTIYAEGQRRYVESLSSYARQFLGIMKKPDVDSITGLSPAISIDQKTTSSNPRSTVGTITEIYNYLRLLFGHVGKAHCPNCNSPIESQTIEEIVKKVLKRIKGSTESVIIVSPLIKNRKGQFKHLLSKLLSRGFLRVIIDNETYLLDDIEDLNLDENKKHTIDLVVDRLTAEDSQSKEFKKRLTDDIELATHESGGEVKVIVGKEELLFSEHNTCTKCGISFPKITPLSFSFNAPEGACNNCTGLGFLKQIDVNLLYNPNLTIREGGIFPWGNRTTKDSWTTRILNEVARVHNFDLKTPIKNYPEEVFNLLFYGEGAKKHYDIEYTNRFGHTNMHSTQYEGVVHELERRYKETSSEYAKLEYEKYMTETVCPLCNGERLKPYSLAVTIQDKNIVDVTRMSIKEASEFFKNLQLAEKSKEKIAEPIVKEILVRLNFLINVGLEYLTLSRQAATLSGGESQRIRLASQIGTGLSGVVYVLDEPSIGLHPRDISKLTESLKELRDEGNSLIIVEHDPETMRQSDWIIDIGPEAGKHGGEIIAEGTFDKIKQEDTMTAKYLSKELVVGKGVVRNQEEENKGEISIKGVRTNNLKNINVTFPLGKLISITGVSGSGKSSLIENTLVPVLENRIMHSKQIEGQYEEIEGVELIDKVISIDQSPIGRTPRSNPATYTGLFTLIRDLYANLNESKARGYKTGRFSFNVKGGRCEKCKGEGEIKIEMQFLSDVYITCDQCHGTRYNSDILQIDYKDKNIAEALKMTVEDALPFFQNHTAITRKLEILNKVGLGYIELGQSALTLSGGESQRVKLAKELSRISTGKTLYILDEPTTGLHYYDIDNLLRILVELVNKGNTVIVVEHNLEIVRNSDWIIDLGPEGGDEGGQIVAEGTVEDIISNPKSYTGKYLKENFKELGIKV
ncbi:MAG TPA: excinuclease ABC subunit UvrA [Candidatus Dojkabacteria bacterium]|nr:excinuclease ABC subunit UvrA [Candidatus Dojkabacteria bacterium]